MPENELAITAGEKTQVGDLPAEYGSLYENFASQGRRYVFSLLADSSESEDVVQDAFCRLINRRQPTAADQFAPVFFTTLRNLAIDVIRKRKRKRAVPLRESDVATTAEAYSSNGTMEIRQQIEQSLSNVPAQWASALRLRTENQLSYAEIAASLGTNQSQVRTWIYRARRQVEADLIRAGLYPGKVT